MLARVAHVANTSDHSNLKILIPKQMLQRLLIALAQVKASNTSEDLLNEIRQICIEPKRSLKKYTAI